MAYRDQNGKITIDEKAAQKDIYQINMSIERLEKARKALNDLIQQSASMHGKMGSAIVEKGSGLLNDINTLIQNLYQEKKAIEQTVAKYRRIDQQVKAAIQSS